MSVVPSNKILISSSRLPGLAVIFPINPYIALSHLFLLLPDNGIGAKTTPAVAALAMKINSPLEILLIDNNITSHSFYCQADLLERRRKT